MADEPAVAAPAAAAPAAPAAQGDKPWHEGADAGLTGYIQNRGWDKLDPKAAALAASRAHHEAEKLIGAPPDQMLRIPKDANDTEGWGKVYSKLGVPADATQYKFDGLKFANGEEVDADFSASVAKIATEQHLTLDQAKGVAKFIVSQIDAAEADEAATYQSKLDAEKNTLKTNWGSNATANMIVAQNAAAKLGVSAEELSALEKTIGYARVMEMFRNVGSRIGEDSFIRDSGGGGNNPVTKEAAQARLNMLEHDADWQERFNKGGARERQEFDNLTRMVAGA